LLLIGLGHKARQGKDTFASECKRAFGRYLNIELHSFADPLREEVREAAKAIFAEAYPDAVFYPQTALRLLCKRVGVEFEENAVRDDDYPWGKQRKLHQWWGTDYRRADDDLYWVKKADAIIENARNTATDVVFFRDLRFPNEFSLMKGQGGYCVKVHRPGWVSDVPQHISETALDGVPFDIEIGVKDENLPLLKQMASQIFLGLLPPDLAIKLSTFIRAYPVAC